MFEFIFQLISDFGLKHPFLKDNSLWRFIRNYYWKIRVLTYPSASQPDATATDFFTKNHDRVIAVSNMLADQQSKHEYLGMIKFRQTRSKQDFPSLVSNKESTYFIDEVQLDNDEVFIDCGAYIGDTIDAFLKRCKDYKHIVSLEPDTVNYNKLTQKYGNNTKITLINAGVYDKDGQMCFAGEGLEGMVVDGDTGQAIQVKKIDNLPLDKCSFIKMDIEGAELNALKGATNTIIKYKPKLAICIYHSNEDMISIAEYIHSIAPDYKLYIRQHMPMPYCVETVLYAL